MMLPRLFSSLWRSVQRAWARLFGYDLFLSHARSDGAGAAEALEARLEQIGFLVFRDVSGLEGAGELTPEIRRAVRRCRLLVVLLTPGALVSPWVAKELALRLAPRRRGLRFLPRRRRVYPVFCHEVRAQTLPAPLRRLGGVLGYELPADEAFDPDVVAESIRKVFGGWRQRAWLRLALALVAGAVLLLAVAIVAQRAAGRRNAERAQWEKAAGTAEAGLRWDVAELAFARAGAADPSARAGLWPRYTEARKRRLLTPRWRLGLAEGQRALWIGEHDGAPVALTYDSEKSRLHLLDEHGEVAAWAVAGSDLPLVEQVAGSACVFAGGTLWKAPLARAAHWSAQPLATGLDAENSVDTMPPVQLLRKGERLLLLGRKAKHWCVLEVDPVTLAIRNDTPLALPVDADTVLRLGHTDQWLALGGSLPHGSRAIDVVGWGVDGQPRTLRPAAGAVNPASTLPDLDMLAVAPDDAQVFVCYYLPRFANPGGMPGDLHAQWLAIDTATVRPAWPLDPRITKLFPVHTHQRLEALYETDNKALHALSFLDFIALDRPPLDLLPRVEAWSFFPQPNDAREDPVIAAAAEDRLLLLRADQRIFELPLPVRLRELESVGILVSASGNHVALRLRPGLDGEKESLLVWEYGIPPAVQTWPDVTALQEQLEVFPPAGKPAP
jgi:hypothetical protein